MVFQCTHLTKYIYDISQIHLESSVSHQIKIRFIAQKMGNPTLTWCVSLIVYRSVPTSGKGKYMQDTILCSPRDIRCLQRRIYARDGHEVDTDLDALLRMIIIIRTVNG